MRLVPCDCASADRPIATTALQESNARSRRQKTANFSGGDTSASRDHRGPFDHATGATAGFDADDSGDGDAGTTTRDDDSDRRAWRSKDGRQDLALRARASTVP